MDNTLINIRLFYWHLQWERGKFHPTISFNAYHWDRGLRVTGWAEVCNFFGYRSRP